MKPIKPGRRVFLLTAGGFVFGMTRGAGVRFADQAGPARRLETGSPVADPFCFRKGDSWYLMGTQHPKGIRDRHFSLFHSRDLIAWEDLGPMLVRPEYEGSGRANYWAPELLESDGSYYLYYTSDSNLDPERRFVRVAVSERIEGPYRDSGRKLVQEPSIDGHPFFTAPGDGILFYCGNEGNPYVGQLLMDRFVSPRKLEERPRRVFPNETVEWEEGPFVIEQSGSYYLFSSTGNWRDGSYHVRVARAASPAGPWERLLEDGVPYRLLKSVEGQSGPGHNSIFRGPDNRWWICYHAWDEARTGRYPWVAPISWDRRGYPLVRQI